MIAAIALIVIAVALLVLLRIDWQPGRYKIVFHRAAQIGLRTVMSPAELAVEGALRFVPSGAPPFVLAASPETYVRVGPFQAMRRMFRVHAEGQDIWFVVVRFSVGGRFILSDAFKGKRLEAVLRETGFAVQPH